MRKHKTKSPLEFSNGVKIQTMDDLRNNFDLKELINIFNGEKLSIWLEDKLYDAEAEEIRKLNIEDKDLPQNLCKIFGVDYETVAEQLDDPETIAWRKERRRRLKRFTDDAEIIKHVDDVAFNQDDLVDILLSEVLPQKIYLCGEKFVFPSGCFRRKNIAYVGVTKDKVIVKIDSKTPIDLDALNITFENVEIDDTYKTISKTKKVPEKISAEKKAVKKVADKKTQAQKKKSKKVKTPEPEPFSYSRTTTVSCRCGVHSRPASVIVQIANKYKSKVNLIAKGKTIEAKSILMLMSMGLVYGTEVTISASGPDEKDAKEAVDALIEWFDCKFNEE